MGPYIEIKAKHIPETHFNLGIALTKLGKTVEAETHFKAAREFKAKTNPGETK